MKTLQKLLKKEEERLERIQHMAEKVVANSPEGKLRISNNKSSFIYYQKKKGDSSADGKYLKKSDMELAEKLAQKEYCEEIAEKASKQRKQIQLLLKVFEDYSLEDVYQNLHPARKCLVKSVTEMDDQYAERWLLKKQQQTEYYGANPYPIKSESYTNNGEIVRSKSEKNIADLLLKLGIPYKYEVPMKLKNGRIVYPDFTILNKQTREEFYLEHLGMMEDPDYVKHHVLEKIPQYEENGIFPGQQLILTMESLEIPLNTKLLEKQLKKLFLE